MKVRKFNLKPRDGVQYLQLRGFLSAEPADISRLLHERRGASL